MKRTKLHFKFCFILMVVFTLKWLNKVDKIKLMSKQTRITYSSDEVHQEPTTPTAIQEGSERNQSNPAYLFWDHKGRQGNNMFEYASAYCMAIHNNLVPTIVDHSILLTMFKNIKAEKISDKFQQQNLSDVKSYPEKGYAIYDTNLTRLVENVSKSIHIGGYLQSYKYFSRCNEDIREQFRVADSIQDEVRVTMVTVVREHLLAQNYTPESNSSTLPQDLTYIGVHARMGLSSFVPDADYFSHAIDYFRRKYKRVLFLICTDYPRLVESRLEKELSQSDVIHVSKRYTSPEIDFGILVNCNHSLITGGTFSWWSGWLAGGEVVYAKGYAEWHTKHQGRGFHWHDYYPHQWTPMT